MFPVYSKWVLDIIVQVEWIEPGTASTMVRPVTNLKTVIKGRAAQFARNKAKFGTNSTTIEGSCYLIDLLALM